jgi:uncharacterized protein (TIGR02271 family)
MSHTVVGIFDTSNEAQTALQQLVSSGFSRDYIDIKPQTTSGASSADRDDDDNVGNFFRNLFGSDERTDRYSKYARNGAVVTVHAQSAQEAERAADILDEYGAVNIDERMAQGGTASDMNAARADATRVDTPQTGRTTSDTNIPIIEEQLHVGKREVETGGVRVRSRIIEKPVEEHLRLREEHVHVERRPVDRAATPADINSFKEGEISMTEHAEVPVVGKEARVVEEVRISKDVEEHDEHVRDTVRRTDVDVQNLTEEQLRTRNTTGTGTENLTEEELRLRRMQDDENDPNRPQNV